MNSSKPKRSSYFALVARQFKRNKLAILELSDSMHPGRDSNPHLQLREGCALSFKLPGHMDIKRKADVTPVDACAYVTPFPAEDSQLNGITALTTEIYV